MDRRAQEQMQWMVDSLPVFHVNLGTARGDEKLDEFLVALRRSQVQGSAAVVVLHVNVDAREVVSPDGHHVARRGGKQQVHYPQPDRVVLVLPGIFRSPPSGLQQVVEPDVQSQTKSALVYFSSHQLIPHTTECNCEFKKRSKRSWDRATFQTNRGLYHLLKKSISINLIPVTISQ
jgi:hypothetical protein